MKNMKSVLAMILAACLILSLAVPVFATGETTTGDTVQTTGAADETTGAESGSRNVIRVIVIVLEVITSIALIGIVLVQSGKESGLSGAISGNSDSYMSKGNRASLDKKLARATKWVALAWVVLTLILSMI